MKTFTTIRHCINVTILISCHLATIYRLAIYEMSYQDKWILNDQGDQSDANKQEILIIFLETLSDILNVKRQLISYVPQMARKSAFKGLRLSILNAGIDINSQIMRLEMVLAILNSELKEPLNIVEGNLKLDRYIKSSLKKSETYLTDVAIISHFIMMESIQITSFELLIRMARCFSNRTIKDLIKQNLNESFKNKGLFDMLLTNYIS